MLLARFGALTAGFAGELIRDCFSYSVLQLVWWRNNRACARSAFSLRVCRRKRFEQYQIMTLA
jgi:hypothetical protein